MPEKNTELEKIKNQEKILLNKKEFHLKTEKIIKNASSDFKGQLPTLESAIGALYVGQIYGWRVLRIAHGSTSYNKYEDILKIKFNEICPEIGVLGRRSWGLRLAEKMESFWKVATGKVKTKGKSLIIDDGTEDPDIPK